MFCALLIFVLVNSKTESQILILLCFRHSLRMEYQRVPRWLLHWCKRYETFKNHIYRSDIVFRVLLFWPSGVFIRCLKAFSRKSILLLHQLVAYNIITTILYDPISYSSGNNKGRGPPAKCNNHWTFYPEIALSLKICKCCTFQLNPSRLVN